MSNYFAIELSLKEIYGWTCSWAYANDMKIMHSKDVQCNTEEPPKGAIISVPHAPFMNYHSPGIGLHDFPKTWK